MVSTGCLAVITSLIGYTAVGIESRCLLATVSGIFKQSMGARNRVGIGLAYRPARFHSLVELVSWNRFLGSLKVLKFGLCFFEIVSLN
jgi:hypothetical protein